MPQHRSHPYNYYLSDDADFQTALNDLVITMTRLTNSPIPKTRIILLGIWLLKTASVADLKAAAANPISQIGVSDDKLILHRTTSFTVSEMSFIRHVDAHLALEAHFITRSVRALVHLGIAYLTTLDADTLKSEYPKMEAYLGELSELNYAVQ